MVHRYRVIIRKRAAKELEAIGHLRDRRAVLARIVALADDPRPPGCTKLSGEDAYRVRQGDYRILFTIDDADVLIEAIRIGHRRDVYR